jgi:hypothetical protein
MSFFARDHAKYFYLAELLSLVDLSLVGSAPTHAALRHGLPRRCVRRPLCRRWSCRTAHLPL